MGVGQHGADCPQRPGWQPRCTQAVAERLGVVLTEHGGKLGTQRLAVGDAVLVARKTNVAAEFGSADLLAELAEGAVVADADKNIGGGGWEKRVGDGSWVFFSCELRRVCIHA